MQSSPGASARPEGRGFKLAIHTSSSGSRARAVGLNNKPLGINPAVLDQNSVSQLSSLGPCAEAEGSLLKDVQDESSSGPRARAELSEFKTTTKEEGYCTKDEPRDDD